MFGSVGHVTLWLNRQRMEGQTQMFWWTSSATDNNWFRKSFKINGKSFNNIKVQIL